MLAKKAALSILTKIIQKQVSMAQGFEIPIDFESEIGLSTFQAFGDLMQGNELQRAKGWVWEIGMVGYLGVNFFLYFAKKMDSHAFTRIHTHQPLALRFVYQILVCSRICVFEMCLRKRQPLAF